MNSRIKPIFLKETNEALKDNKFILSTILNIVTMSVMALVVMNYANTSSNGMIIQIGYMVILPSFSMWILSVPFIQEKFWNVKIVNGFQPLLTLPIKLIDIWVGKIGAIFVLTYPSTFLITIILALIYFTLTGINPLISLPLSLWIVILILGPLTIMNYNALASWIALRFNSPRLNDILQYGSILIIIFAFIGLVKISEIVTVLHFNEWTVILIGILIMGIFTAVIYYLINNLKKEKVIT